MTFYQALAEIEIAIVNGPVDDCIYLDKPESTCQCYTHKALSKIRSAVMPLIEDESIVLEDDEVDE